MKAYMNGDVDCDVSSSKTYTHAYDINAGTGDLVINGVTFTGIDGLNSEPGASDFTTTGFSGNINTYTGDLPASSNVSGQMGELTSGFNFCLYDSTPDGTLTLTGLEVGKTYATTLYNMTWDSVTRPVDITTSEGDAFSFDENYNRNGGNRRRSRQCACLLLYGYRHKYDHEFLMPKESIFIFLVFRTKNSMSIRVPLP